MKKILSVVGARPNFMKMAPVHKELLKHKPLFNHKIIHTGQHYDKKMSDIFFKELELPKPHTDLGVGSMSHAEQVAKIMTEFEKIVLKEKPDLVLVYGDVNSTAAASMVCAKILDKKGNPVPVGHVEAGLRSFDGTMPEEVNRKVTDVLSSYLFVTEKSGQDNLRNEGVKRSRIFFTGNTMIDSLVHYLGKAEKSRILRDLALSNGRYALVTLHRPSNVDNKKNLKRILEAFNIINESNPETDIVFPIHPRTAKMIVEFKLNKKFNKVKNLITTDPLGYIDFLKLTASAKYVLTDSGGIQEETTYLKVPCLTLRENTERPVTVTSGTNTVCGLDASLIRREIMRIEKNRYKRGKTPRYWDGKSAERIVNVLKDVLQ